MISLADFDKIAEAGNIKNSADPNESEIPDLMRALVGWSRHREILLTADQQNLGPKQQFALAQEFAGLVGRSADFIRHNPQVRSLLTASAQRHAGNVLTGASLHRALDDIPEQVRQCFVQLAQFQVSAAACIDELQAGPVLPVMANAAKQTSHHLSLSVLLYLAAHGRLGAKKPTSDTDPRVKFAHAVFNYFERGCLKLSAARDSETLKLGAVRRRLAAEFERAKRLSTRHPPDLGAVRKARAQWVMAAVEEFRKDPSVSAEDARQLADGMAVDLSVDPREAVRRFVATWND